MLLTAIRRFAGCHACRHHHTRCGGGLVTEGTRACAESNAFDSIDEVKELLEGVGR